MTPFSDTSLTLTHNLVKISVLSSSKIEARTATVISRLNAKAEGKPVLLALTAKARTASKLISIVEIAKRELNIPYYQYTVLTSETIEIPHESAQKTSCEPDEGDGEDATAFQTMGAPMTARKIRSVPVLTIYLSRHEAKVLAKEFG